MASRRRLNAARPWLGAVAVVAMTTASLAFAQSADELKSRGNQAMMELNYAEALASYRAALEKNPSDVGRDDVRRRRQVRLERGLVRRRLVRAGGRASARSRWRSAVVGRRRRRERTVADLRGCRRYARARDAGVRAARTPARRGERTRPLLRGESARRSRVQSGRGHDADPRDQRRSGRDRRRAARRADGTRAVRDGPHAGRAEQRDRSPRRRWGVPLLLAPSIGGYRLERCAGGLAESSPEAARTMRLRSSQRAVRAPKTNGTQLPPARPWRAAGKRRRRRRRPPAPRTPPAARGGKPPRACEADASDCIIARRTFAFAEHVSRKVSVRLDADCLGVKCDEGSTCVGAPARCVDATTVCDGTACLLPSETPSGGPGGPDPTKDGQAPDPGTDGGDEPVDGGDDGGARPVVGGCISSMGWLVRGTMPGPRLAAASTTTLYWVKKASETVARLAIRPKRID